MTDRSIFGRNENSDAPSYGLAFCLLGRAEAVLLARGAGFDFIVIDMEHGPLTLSDLGQAAAAAQAAGIPLFGRVTGPHSPDIARVLDCGATGVIVPHVDSAEDAGRIVNACRFAPVGARALPGPLPALDYRVVPAAELTETAEAQTRIVVMIESAEALQNVEAIAATAGVDMLIIGSNDLADGMGLRGQLGHPDIAAAFKRISKAAHDNGCSFGVMGLPQNLVQPLAIDLGASAIVATNETNLISDGGAALLATLKGAT